MTETQYISGVLARYKPTPQFLVRAAIAKTQLFRILKGWAGANLNGVYVSGSIAKGTAISGNTDLDYLVSLKPSTNETLSEIYNTLFVYLEKHGFHPRRQNVSIGLPIGNFKIDLIPAKKWPGNTFAHSLYNRKSKTWLKTNTARHVKVVTESRRQAIIRLMKIWRNVHGLQFPSFCLEMATINALRGTRLLPLSRQFECALEHVAFHLPHERIEDPANTANNLADDMSNTEKLSVANQAFNSLKKTYWSEIVW